jgi:hypothetical protein
LLVARQQLLQDSVFLRVPLHGKALINIILFALATNWECCEADCPADLLLSPAVEIPKKTPSSANFYYEQLIETLAASFLIDDRSQSIK